MKTVICVDDFGILGLKFGQEYCAVSETSDYYIIKTITGLENYSKRRFKLKETMKPKLDLTNKDLNWCVRSTNRRLLDWLGKTYRGQSAFFNGTGTYYGVQNGKEMSTTYPFDKEYTLEEFLDAFEELEWQPKCGDTIEVSNTLSQWHKRIFIAKKEDGKIICVVEDHNGWFNNNDIQFTVAIWDKMRKPQPAVKINIEVTVNGAKKDPKDFSDAEWLAFKNK